jgi:hypothetical protein
VKFTGFWQTPMQFLGRQDLGAQKLNQRKTIIILKSKQVKYTFHLQLASFEIIALENK